MHLPLALALAGLLLLAPASTRARAEDGGGRARPPRPDCSWRQWGRTADHDGSSCAVGQPPQRELAHLTIDPFVALEQAESGGDLLTHYQVPLADASGHVFALHQKGVYVPCDPPGSGQPTPCGAGAWATMVWSERALVWRRGALVDAWSFDTDWKPVPLANGWEPVFQPALAARFLYVPGAGGSLYKLNIANGAVRKHILPFGAATAANTYVVGGLAIDGRGNVYYNALRLDPAQPWRADAQGFLVRVTPGDQATVVDYGTLVPDAPAASEPCYRTFAAASPPPDLPWPPPPLADGSPALPPQEPCLSQRPAVNVTPAVAADGTIFTISRAHANGAYAYLVALDPELHAKWASSLRGRLVDGCGVKLPFGSRPDLSNCRIGGTPGVDPLTDLPPAVAADDASSSSPTALPDGGVVYGGLTLYNEARGHLVAFDGSGGFAGSFDFGWDTSPAVYRHDGTYSIVLKDNHYAGGPYFITQLDAGLGIEWQFRATNTQTCQRQPDGTITCHDGGEHPNGFEWCVNAPAIDADGTIFVTSEDGNLYAIAQGGAVRSQVFLAQALGAAYTPLSLDPGGRIYAMNNGELFVLGSSGGAAALAPLPGAPAPP